MSRGVSGPFAGAGRMLSSTMASTQGLPKLIWQLSSALVATSVPLALPVTRHQPVPLGTAARALCSLEPRNVLTRSSRTGAASLGCSAASRSASGSLLAGAGGGGVGGGELGTGPLGGRVPAGGPLRFGGGFGCGLLGGVFARTGGFGGGGAGGAGLFSTGMR